MPEACRGNTLLGEKGCETNGAGNFDRIHFWRTPVAACGEVPLRHVLQSAFRPALVEQFDTVFLVDGTGTVLAVARQSARCLIYGIATTAAQDTTGATTGTVTPPYSGAGTDTLVNFENLTGSAGADDLTVVLQDGRRLKAKVTLTVSSRRTSWAGGGRKSSTT